jgi:hypothetical protein
MMVVADWYLYLYLYLYYLNDTVILLCTTAFCDNVRASALQYVLLNTMNAVVVYEYDWLHL